MAQYYWRGETVKITIGNIQKSTSGVSKVVESGIGADGWGLTNTKYTAPTSTSNGSYVGYFTIKHEGSFEDSKILTAKLVTYWTGGGYSDEHTASFTALNPATSLNASSNGTYFWAEDTPKVTFDAYSYGGETKSFIKSPTISSPTLSNTTYFSATTSGNEATINIKTGVEIHGSESTTVSWTSTAGSLQGTGTAPSGAVIAPTAITGTSKTIQVKNSVKEILVGQESDPQGSQGSTAISLYTEADSYIGFSYVVNPLYAGTPYSYVVTLNNTSGMDVSNVTTVSKNIPGKVKVKKATPGTYELTLTSSAAKTSKTSPKITVFVSPKSSALYLNPGDSTTIDVGYPVSVANVTLGTGLQGKVTVTTNGNNVTLTVNTSASAVSTNNDVNVNNVKVATLSIAHIDVTLS